jgi:hypothetical protein
MLGYLTERLIRLAREGLLAAASRRRHAHALAALAARRYPAAALWMCTGNHRGAGLFSILRSVTAPELADLMSSPTGA